MSEMETHALDQEEVRALALKITAIFKTHFKSPQGNPQVAAMQMMIALGALEVTKLSVQDTASDMGFEINAKSIKMNDLKQGMQ